MKKSNINPHGFTLISAMVSLLLTGCSLDLSISSLVNRPTGTISGSISNFAGAASASSLATCAGERVALFELDHQGQKLNKISDTTVDATGSFHFSGLAELGVDIRDSMDGARYLIEFSCGSSTTRRYVNGPNDQDLASGTTLLTWLSQTPLASLLSRMTADDLAQFYKSLGSSSSVTVAFSTLNSNAALKAKFQQLFGADPSILVDALPEIQTTSVPQSFNEEQPQALSVQATQWSPSYNIAYNWKVGSSTLSNSANWTYTPSANAQGNRTIQLFVGHDDGAGGIDLAKPYLQKIFPITVRNTSPATGPGMTLLTSQMTSSLTAQVRLTTGSLVDGIPQNCKSFSHLALVEDDYPGVSMAPLLPSSYSLDCTTAVTQDFSFTLSGAEGPRSLRLWALDSSGNISLASSDVSLTIDRTNPVIALTSLNGGSVVQGGSPVTLSWTSVELNPAINPITLAYSLDNGATWTTIASSIADTGSYSWTTPLADSASAKVRVTMIDKAGNTGSVISATAFTIDSTAPVAPTVARTSAAFSNSMAVTLSLTCNPDFAAVFLSSSSTPPLAADLGWQACAASMNTLVPTGDGVKTIYVFAKDVAANISPSSSVTMTLDQTNPSLSLTSFNTAQAYKGGSSQAITWTASDAGSGFGSSPISLFFSTDGGTSWTAIAVSTANDGTESWTLPSIDSTNVTIKVTATDRAGNVSTAISSSAFTIDSTAPVISSTIINDGAIYAGSALINVKSSVTDNLSSAAQISLRLASANGGTGDCQSEYADNGWTTYTNATTNIGFTITPVDGTKKICVWAKDAAGNVSVASPTAGTMGVDTSSIQFQVGHPPEFVGFSASRTSDSATSGITTGQGLTISYSISDLEGLDNNPISIAYTTNNVLWKDIVTNQDITNLSNMTWLGGLSGNPTSSSGTISTWNAPTSGYFRLKAVAKDMSGNSSVPAMSGGLNLSNWSIYAGSTDRGDGGSGKTAKLNCNPYGAMFAINPKNGDVYAADCSYGLRKMDAKTGIITTVIPYGANNLPDVGPLPATPRFETSYYTNPHFDKAGRLYIAHTITDGRSEVYQIDFQNNLVRKYVGGGYASSGGSAPLTMAIAPSGYSFDEDDTLYFFTWCGGTPINRLVSGKKIHKLTQNPDGSAGTVSDVAGDCSRTALSVYGVPATSSTIGSSYYPELSGIAAWNHGQNIYVNMYGVRFKIIGGTIYSSNTPAAYRTSWIYYNPANGKLYSSNTTGGISMTTPSLAGNGGEVVTTWFNGNSTTPGCNIDGVSIANYCGADDIKIAANNGQIFFADGAVSNSGSDYSIRFVDAQNNVQTLMGALPLFGDGKQKGLIRGAIGGIYYKKSTEGNQAAFPEGLYFMDYAGVTFNYIDPATGIMQTLWGNQNRASANIVNGNTISKNTSMSTPYSGGEAYALTFDDTGLPWMRTNLQLLKINSSKQVVFQTSGSAFWDTLVDGANPATARMYVFGSSTNIALKGQTFFAIGGAYVNLIGSIDPVVGIKAMDFGSATTTKLFGGTAKYSQSLASVADVGAGQVPSTTMWYQCGTGTNCYTAYDTNTDRLYFSENNLIRYITTPSNTATSTLVTLYSNASQIFNLTVSPDGSQVWFSKGSSLYCKDISSGKSWCDSTTNYFQSMASAGFSLGRVANQFTWKDNSTLFVSSNAGLIYQFTLPTGP